MFTYNAIFLLSFSLLSVSLLLFLHPLCLSTLKKPNLMVQGVECLPSKCEALNSNASTAKIKTAQVNSLVYVPSYFSLCQYNPTNLYYTNVNKLI
jgi:hypothetical protein